MTNKETVDEAVQESFEKLFEALIEEFQIKTGDVSPEQMEGIEDVQDKLSKLCLEWVEQKAKNEGKNFYLRKFD